MALPTAWRAEEKDGHDACVYLLMLDVDLSGRPVAHLGDFAIVREAASGARSLERSIGEL